MLFNAGGRRTELKRFVLLGCFVFLALFLGVILTPLTAEALTVYSYHDGKIPYRNNTRLGWMSNSSTTYNRPSASNPSRWDAARPYEADFAYGPDIVPEWVPNGPADVLNKYGYVGWLKNGPWEWSGPLRDSFNFSGEGSDALWYVNGPFGYGPYFRATNGTYNRYRRGVKVNYRKEVPDIPPVPAAPTGTVGGLSWHASEGRGYVVLKWNKVARAEGYKVWVYDGQAYRSYDVGNKTTWDSRTAKIYPTEAEINSYETDTRTANIFKNGTGLDLRDDPSNLYRSAKNSQYNNRKNYWFRVSAYNITGESSRSDAYMPTLPNRTDTVVPQHVTYSVTGERYRDGNVYWVRPGDTLQFSVTGTDNESGVRRNYLRLYADASNDVRAYYQFTGSGSFSEYWPAPQVTIPSGAKQSYASPGSAKSSFNVTITGDTELDYRIHHYYMDNVNNTSGWTSTGWVKVDNTKPSAPIIELDSNEWATSHTFFISGGSDSRSGISHYQYRIVVDGGESTSWINGATGIVDIEGRVTVYARAIDRVGNEGLTSKVPVRVDRSPPTPPDLNLDQSWTDADRTFTISGGYDQYSGISHYEYRLSNDGGITWSDWVKYPGSEVTARSSDGITYVQARAVDYVGHVSEPTEPKMARVKKTPPEIYADPESVLEWSNGVEVELTFSDEYDLFAFSRYAWSNSSEWPDTGWSEYSFAPSRVVTQSEDGEWWLHVIAQDYLGNTSQATFGPYRVSLVDMGSIEPEWVLFGEPGDWPIYAKAGSLVLFRVQFVGNIDQAWAVINDKDTGNVVDVVDLNQLVGGIYRGEFKVPQNAPPGKVYDIYVHVMDVKGRHFSFYHDQFVIVQGSVWERIRLKFIR